MGMKMRYGNHEDNWIVYSLSDGIKKDTELMSLTKAYNLLQTIDGGKYIYCKRGWNKGTLIDKSIQIKRKIRIKEYIYVKYNFYGIMQSFFRNKRKNKMSIKQNKESLFIRLAKLENHIYNNIFVEYRAKQIDPKKYHLKYKSKFRKMHWWCIKLVFDKDKLPIYRVVSLRSVLDWLPSNHFEKSKCFHGPFVGSIIRRGDRISWTAMRYEQYSIMSFICYYFAKKIDQICQKYKKRVGNWEYIKYESNDNKLYIPEKIDYITTIDLVQPHLNYAGGIKCNKGLFKGYVLKYGERIPWLIRLLDIKSFPLWIRWLKSIYCFLYRVD